MECSFKFSGFDEVDKSLKAAAMGDYGRET